MKRSIPFVLILILAITASNYLVKDTTTSYAPREGAVTEGSHGAQEIRKNLLADPATGEIDHNAIRAVEADLQKRGATRNNKSVDLDWTSAGPNNVGGRTRAIMSYPNEPAKLIIGSVSGGLYRSNNSGAEWTRIDSFDENMMVSSIARTGNGIIYVGTGHRYEDNFVGNGLYASEDDGATWNIVQNFKPSSELNSGEDWSTISVLMADPTDNNRVWIGYRGGLASYDWGDTDVTEHVTLATTSLSISDNGEVIVAVCQNSVYVSTDGGGSFNSASGNGFGEVPTGSVGRIEVAVSPDQPDYMYALAAGSNSYLKGMYASTDRGDTWYEVYGNSELGTLPFSPFSNAIQGQGVYDNCITVVPGQPTVTILGGIRVYKVEIAGQNPPAAQWNLLNINFSNGPNPLYVHSDIHTFHWDSNDNLYIGCDGGIFRTEDNGETFSSRNYNYRSTQFYGIDFSSRGAVIGGTQDNGTHIVTGNNISNNDSNDVLGGDGFDCNISKFDSNIGFATIYNNDVNRTVDGGLSGTQILSQAAFDGPFWTIIDLYERIDEDMATEIIPFTATIDYQEGDVIEYASRNYGMALSYELTDDLGTGEEIMLPDPTQTLFCVGGYGSFLITRDALRSDIASGEIAWTTISSGIGGTVTCFEFSPDGDAVYIGTANGSVYRMDGLRNAYTADDIAALESNVTTLLAGGPQITDMAVDVNNPDRLMISRATYTTVDKLMISETATTTSASNTFEGVWNFDDNLSRMPVYSCTFDKNTPDRLFAGTEYGVWVSDDYGDTWEESNGIMGRVPVYALEQQTMTVDDLGPLGSYLANDGAIYAGTFGKGIYYVGDYVLGVDDLDTSDNEFQIEMSVYPNPVVETATLALDLAKAANVNVNIFDMQGRLAQTLPQGRLASGKQRIAIDAQALAEGTYTVQVTVDDRADAIRFIVNK